MQTGCFSSASHAVTTVPIAISAIDRWNQKTFPITMPFANALSPTSGVAISIATKTDASAVRIPLPMQFEFHAGVFYFHAYPFFIRFSS